MNADLTIAVETSSRRGGVAIARGDDILDVRYIAADRRHAAELLPTIRDLLAEHGCVFKEITLFAFSQGPGSFTGLRIAAAAASLAQSTTGCQVVAVPTLEAVAVNALQHPGDFNRIAPVLDAKSGRIFAACYEGAADGLKQRIAPGLHQAADFLKQIEPPFAVLGEGVPACQDACQAADALVLDEECWLPSADNVLRIARRRAAAGQFCRPDQIVPLYLRPPACEEVYEQRRAAARQRRGE